jgi:hypothetical protein
VLIVLLLDSDLCDPISGLCELCLPSQGGWRAIIYGEQR